jgi:hypothetical protein
VSKLDRRYRRAMEVFEKGAVQPERERRFRISLGQPVGRGTELQIHGREEASDQGKRFVGPDGFEPSASPLSGVRSNRAELWAQATDLITRHPRAARPHHVALAERIGSHAPNSRLVRTTSRSNS